MPQKVSRSGGRPRLFKNVLSAGERMQRSREKHREAGGSQILVTFDFQTTECLDLLAEAAGLSRKAMLEHLAKQAIDQETISLWNNKTK